VSGCDGPSERRVVLLPGAPVLLPSRASLVDPVPELRAAVGSVLSRALDGAGSVLLLTDEVDAAGRARGVREPAGLRVGRALLASYGFDGEVVEHVLPADEPLPATDVVLALASGSAKRRDTSPGYVDDRAIPFDDALEAALRAPDAVALGGLDVGLAEELWVTGALTFRALGGLLAGAGPAQVDLAADPYGVQYWVMRWTCGS
jgi:hypothetical protein